jgi:hypothetical protein
MGAKKEREITAEYYRGCIPDQRLKGKNGTHPFYKHQNNLNVSTCSFSTFANSFFVNKSSATNIYLF